MTCARAVFRCFRAVERCADRITGAAGPYFVALAVALISLGTLCFFEVVLPALPWPLLSVPTCCLIAFNLFMHYFWACTTPPGFTNAPEPKHTGWLWAQRRRRRENVEISPAEVTQCRKCSGEKPERTHHCRICNRCVLKYDHHCPVRINQCVGLHNERHFVLFMFYFVVSTAVYCALGYYYLLTALGVYIDDWPYLLPQSAFVLIYLLAIVLCIAVALMLSFHIWGIVVGETSVESHDFPMYRERAKSRGNTFVNCYDLGKRQNLELFFNVGPHGEYSYLTLIFPYRICPYTNGRAWARRPGLARHQGVERADEFTDDEDGPSEP
ncbi:hypothetical protein AX14_014457 [Amanita brunnescens Koide BX004]|nr:hypothetical protein AX14_014457 [Amanita brunnescens Koide BX004]